MDPENPNLWGLLVFLTVCMDVLLAGLSVHHVQYCCRPEEGIIAWDLNYKHLWAATWVLELKPSLLFCASLRPNFQFKNYWGLCVACLWNSRENPVLVRSVLPLYTSPKTQTVRLASKHICTCALNIWKCAHMHTCTHTLHTRKKRKTQCFHGIDAMKASFTFQMLERFATLSTCLRFQKHNFVISYF